MARLLTGVAERRFGCAGYDVLANEVERVRPVQQRPRQGTWLDI